MPLPGLRRGVIAALILATPWLAAGAQGNTGTVRGRITDAASGRGLGDAQILVADTRIGALSAIDGSFALVNVPVGTRAITVRRLGFQPVTRTITIAMGATATLDVALQVSAMNLSEIVVTGSAAPTERRKIGTSIASVDSTLITRAGRDHDRSGAAGEEWPVRRSRRTPVARAAVASPYACAGPTPSSRAPTRCTSSTV